MGGEQSRTGTQKEEEEEEAPAKSGEPESAAEGKHLKVWKKVETKATLICCSGCFCTHSGAVEVSHGPPASGHAPRQSHGAP